MDNESVTSFFSNFSSVYEMWKMFEIGESNFMKSKSMQRFSFLMLNDVHNTTMVENEMDSI